MNIFGNDIDPGDNNKDMEDQDADVCRVCRMEGSVYKNKNKYFDEKTRKIEPCKIYS